MANDATIKSRAAIPQQARYEAKYVYDTLGGMGVVVENERADCMKGNFAGKDTTYKGQPINRTKVCLAEMDASMATQFQFSDTPIPYQYAPYHAIARDLSLNGSNLSTADAIARSINTAILKSPNNTPNQSPISASIEIYNKKTGLPETLDLPLKGGHAVEAGYLMALTYFNANAMDQMNLNPAMAKLSQEQVEQYAEACYTNNARANLPYGTCIGIGAEYGVRSIPRIKEQVEAEKRRR